MMVHHLTTVMLRDLAGVRAQIEAYPDDALLWRTVPALPNSGGNLVLHVVGNLRHFIGAVLGADGYVRDRDSEFSSRGLTRQELLGQIETTRRAVERTLGELDPTRLEADYPQAVAGLRLRTGEFLVHLVSHLGYHLGQIDFHRRSVTGAPQSAGAQSLAALSSARPVSAREQGRA